MLLSSHGLSLAAGHPGVLILFDAQHPPELSPLVFLGQIPREAPDGSL